MISSSWLVIAQCSQCFYVCMQAEKDTERDLWCRWNVIHMMTRVSLSQEQTVQRPSQKLVKETQGHEVSRQLCPYPMARDSMGEKNWSSITLWFVEMLGVGSLNNETVKHCLAKNKNSSPLLRINNRFAHRRLLQRWAGDGGAGAAAEKIVIQELQTLQSLSKCANKQQAPLAARISNSSGAPSYYPNLAASFPPVQRPSKNMLFC